MPYSDNTCPQCGKDTTHLQWKWKEKTEMNMQRQYLLIHGGIDENAWKKIRKIYQSGYWENIFDKSLRLKVWGKFMGQSGLVTEGH